MFNPEKELTKLLIQKNWSLSDLCTSDHLKEIARESLFDFEQWMLIVKHAVPEDAIYIMNTYAMHVNKLHDVRDAFEYASIHEQTSVLESLLDKHGTDDLLREWILVYQLILETLLNTYSQHETLEKAKNLYAEIQNPLARMRLDIIELSTYFNMGSVRNILFLANKVRNDFTAIKPGYMKSALASRVSLLIGAGKLYGEGDIQSAEDYLFAVNVNEATPDAIKASSFHALSNTKLIGDKRLCLEYTEEAIKFARQANLSHYEQVLEQEQIPFIKNLYGEVFNLSVNTSKEEQIHQYFVRNETAQALEIIKELEDEGRESLFLLYYKGKVTKDVELLTKAISQFSIFGRADMVPVVQRDIISLQKTGVYL